MDTVRIKIQLEEAAKFAGEARIASAEIDGLGDAAARADKKTRKAADGMNILQKAVKPAKWIALAGVITQTTSLATGGVFALVAALAPAIGLLGALPAAGFAAAMGLGVLKLGFMGVGAAVGGLDAQMNPKKFLALQRPAQQFALTLNSLKAPILALQKRVQNGLFPGLTAGLKAARPLIGALSGPLAGTARIFGQFGDKLGHLVGSKGFLSDLKSQAEFNNVQFRRLGGAALHVVDAFRQLMVASRPLITSLVHMVDGWAKSADAMLTAGRKSGSLQAFFRRTAVVIRDVVKIGGNLVATLINIGRIGAKQVGGSLLNSLVRGSAALRKWSSSAEGTRKITGYFNAVKGALHEVGGAITKVGGILTSLGSSGGLRGLGLVAVAIGKIATGVAWVARTIPGSAPAIVALASGFWLFKKLKIAEAIGGIWKAAKYLFGGGLLKTGAKVISKLGEALAPIRDLCLGTRLGLLRLAVADKVATGFTALKTGLLAVRTGLTSGLVTAFWSLDAAMDANPVAVIALGVAALAGAFYLAYTKVRWFHNAVNDTFNWLKKHWPLVLGIVTGPIGLAVVEIIKHWGTIKRGASDVLHFVGGIFTSVANFIIGGVNTAIGAINAIIGGVNDVSGILGIGKIAKIGTIAPLGGGVSPASFAVGKTASGTAGASLGAHGTAKVGTPPHLAAPSHAKVTRAHTASVAAPIVVHSHVTVKAELKTDGKKIAQSTSNAVGISRATA